MPIEAALRSRLSGWPRPTTLRQARPRRATRRSIERFAEAGIEPLVGSVGDSYDNALAETVNGLYETELIWRRGPWRSVEAVELAALAWVHWFNTRRLLEPVGYVPPAEFESMYYQEQHTLAMADGFN